MSDEIERYKARYRREKASRKEAEQLLEDKSRELYLLNNNLKELTETLEHKVAIRTADLAKARDKAIRLSQVKSDFLANMSHELRTPMNGVLGMLNLLKESDLSIKAEKLVETAAHSGELLLEVINDILDYTKLEADKLSIESIEFTPIELLEGTTQPFFSMAQKKGIELITVFPPELPIALKGDPTRIKQIISNLISNAIKFTEHGEVVVKAQYDNGVFRLVVTDTGVGIPENQIKHIFMAFSQADESTTRKFGGTGLGLSICSSLVKLMDGKIDVQSMPNKGSTFSLDVPLELIALTSDPEKAEEQPSLTNNVIVAAKHPLKQKMLCSLITNWRMGNAEVFSEGESLLSRLENDDVDLMLIEEIIFEEYSHLRGFIKDFCDFKVIVLTNKDDVETKENDFIHMSLPYKQSELYNIIAPIFGLNTISMSSKSAFKSIRFKEQHILLVEDNATNQEVAKEILKLVNLKVTVAENGQQGVDLVKTDKFVLVLMDIQMPVMDGLTATKTIRQMGDKYKDLPIIAMTAHGLPGDREKSLSAGMNDHVTKPIDPKILFGTIAEYLAFEEVEQQGDSNGDDASTNIGPVESTKSSLPIAEGDSQQNSIDSYGGLDIKSSLKRMNGNATLLKKVLAMYDQQQNAFFDQFNREKQALNIEELVRLAHTLKGSSANVGANNVSAIAKDLECYLKKALPDIDDAENGLSNDVEKAISSTKLDLMLSQLKIEIELTTASIQALEKTNSM